MGKKKSAPVDYHVTATNSSSTGGSTVVVVSAANAAAKQPVAFPWSDPNVGEIQGTGTLDVPAFIKRHLKKSRKTAHYVEYTSNELALLLEKVQPIFERQPTLVEAVAPITVVGDIHGQFSDLLRIFSAAGYPHQTSFLFLGDYIDRGPHNLECICLLLAYKCLYPDHLHLLRGNHECRNINYTYGFMEELANRTENVATAKALFRKFNDTFGYMPLAAVVSGRVLCMHGGISPHLKSFNSIRELKRPIMETAELSQDLLWADPDKSVTVQGGYLPNQVRGISVQFGVSAVEEMLELLDIDLVVRAHQVVQDGYEFFADRKLLTIFSAPKYCDEFENAAGLLRIDKALRCSLTILTPIDPPLSARSANHSMTVSHTTKSQTPGRPPNKEID